MNIKNAKDFFSQKIIQSASRENITFDSLEVQMLYWSTEHEDMDLQEKFAKKHNDADYEKKVSNLLSITYDYDREHNPDDLQKYKEAYDALRKGDHYLLVMLGSSIGWRFSPLGWFRLGKESKSIPDLLVLIFSALVVGILMMICIGLYRHFSGQ